MARMVRPAVAAIGIVLLLGCAQTQTPGKSSATQPQSPDRLTIETASSTVEVDDLEAGVVAARALIEAHGGTISSSNVHEKSATLNARVPSETLDSFLDALSELGDEKSRSTTSRDVTEEYADLEAEIANLRALRDRLRALLDRAKTVEDVLKVERELTRVQTKLDSLEGGRDRMTNQIRFSAVALQLFEKPPERILGPLGLLYEGTRWFVRKLFVISP